MNVGDTIIFRAEYRDRDGIHADPNNVTGWVRLPNDDILSVQMDRVVNGAYEGEFSITMEGEHWFRVESTGVINSAKEKRFTVAVQRVVT